MENENNTDFLETGKIIKVDIDEQMRSSYIDYSMSVIVARALPEVRDGLKPVHRRVLFGMSQAHNTSDKPTKKSARIVGDVMGKYHPHGDSSIYGTLVRLAQPWNMRYCLAEGQGNFGNIDGDGPAAMRYTEVRLTKIAEEMLRDIDKDTVDMVDNFDNSEKEPVVLPTRIPNLLVNGASGIAVGMATNMPTHNLSEVVDGIVAYIDDPDITIEGLMQYIKAPDFPTGGIIYGYQGVRDAYNTGRGRIVIRSRCEIEMDNDGRERIIIKEIPYQVVKSELVKSIADLVRDKRLDGISDISDHTSKKEGLSIVIEIKRDANANVVLNKLYKMTALQSSFSVNNIALVKGRPKLLNLHDLVSNFVEHRMDVVTRRTQFELRKAQERMHVLDGLIIAVDNIDEVIHIIRSSRAADEARQRLMERFGMTDIQSRYVVDMRLRALTGLAIEDLKREYEEVKARIEYLTKVLADEKLRYDIVKQEMLEIKEQYGDERKTQIVMSAGEFTDIDFIADDEVVITVSHMGYIKSTPLAEFRAQGRGGKGSKGSGTRDTDFIEYIYPATRHNTLLIFTQRGRCYWLKVYELPEDGKNSKGRYINNLLNLEAGDSINALIPIQNLNDSDFVNSHYVVFATKQGIIKKTVLEAYSRPRAAGVNAIIIRDDDRVVDVCLTDGNSDVVIANRLGRAIRFNENTVRSMGRMSTGVRAMNLREEGNEVVGMVCVPQNSGQTIMVVSANGFGKRTNLDETDENGNVVPVYRITNRGGQGVKTINVTEKTGELIAIKAVNDDNDLMIINRSGITLRLRVADVRVMGRLTQGVKLIDLRKDTIASVCCVSTEPDEEAAQVEQNGEELPAEPVSDEPEEILPDETVE